MANMTPAESIGEFLTDQIDKLYANAATLRAAAQAARDEAEGHDGIAERLENLAAKLDTLRAQALEGEVLA